MNVARMEATEAPRVSPWETIADVVLAPTRAFERIALVPVWVWALVLLEILVAISAIVTLPASTHAVLAFYRELFAHDPHFMTTPPDQQARILAAIPRNTPWNVLVLVVVVPIFALLQAGVMMIVAMLAAKRVSFSRMLAAAVHVCLISIGLYSILWAVIVAIRTPDAFNSLLELSTAMPSLALLAPNSGKLTAVLAQANAFSIWGAVLYYLAMRVVAGVPKGAAYAVAAIMLLVPALWAFLTVPAR